MWLPRSVVVRLERRQSNNTKEPNYWSRFNVALPFRQHKKIIYGLKRFNNSEIHYSAPHT
jgi:hypothetical protein